MNFLITYCVALLLAGTLPEFRKNTPDNLYIGIENYFHIQLNSCNPEDISVKVTSGIAYKRDDTTYAFNPQIDDQELKVKLYYKKVLCEVKSMVVKKIPDQVLILDGENGGFIKHSELEYIKNLTLRYPDDFPIELRSTITGFNLFLKDVKGNVSFSAYIQGDKISDDALKFILKLTKGARIAFNNVITTSQKTGQSRVNATKEVVVID